MAQLRLRNFEHPILSFEHNLFNIGFHSAGRYVGFDTMVKEAGLSFRLSHAISGLRYKNPNLEVIGPVGVYMTPQGTIVQETDVVGPFTVASNVGNASVRYDLIFAHHDQVEINGGSDANYQYIRGPIGSTALPTFGDSTTNTILGYVRVPAGEASDINNCTWIKARCPDSGDGPDARLDLENIFLKFQGYKLSADLLVVPTETYAIGLLSRSLWRFKTDGNTFRLSPPDTAPGVTLDAVGFVDLPYQDGYRIYIQINNNIRVRNTNITTQKHDEGYRSFKWVNAFDTVNGPEGTEIRPPYGQIWELECVLINDFWQITAVHGKSDSTAGEIMMWSGLTTRIPPNWRLADGSILNINLFKSLYDNIGGSFGGDGVTTFALPNLKKRFIVGYDTGDINYSVIGETGGEPTHTLALTEIPGHRHHISASSNNDTAQGGFGAVPGIDVDTIESGGDTDLAGGGLPHNNLPPYFVLAYLIKMF